MRWRLHTEAENELADAVLWYEEKRKGLGRELVLAVRARVQEIVATPSIARPVPGAPGVMQVRLRRFPYVLRFVELPDERFVLAVSHERRDPRYWIGRLPAAR